jgi:hypothetical protein
VISGAGDRQRFCLSGRGFLTAGLERAEDRDGE